MRRMLVNPTSSLISTTNESPWQRLRTIMYKFFKKIKKIKSLLIYFDSFNGEEVGATF